MITGTRSDLIATIFVYTYLAAFVLMPVYLLVTCLVLYRRYGRTRHPYLVACAGFAWPLLPLVPWLLTHPSQWTDQLRMYGFFSGDTSYINATRQAGVFPYALAVLLPVGLYAVLSVRRMRMAETLLLGFFLAPIAAVLVAEVKINRALVVLSAQRVSRSLIADATAEKTMSPTRTAPALVKCRKS